MRVLFVTTELYPFVKTGGLGDVSSALPQALRRQGTDIRYLIPGYTRILERMTDVEILQSWPFYMGVSDLQLAVGTLPGNIPAYVIMAPGLFNREGLYCDVQGQAWEDNHRRFAILSRMAAELHRYDLSWSADVIHGNDWFCGLIPAYMMPQGRRPAHVITIHNLLYQGVFPSKILPELELAGAAANETAYYGQASFLRAGLACADRITTVSPTYAREIRAQEHGCGMHDLLEARAASLSGILNGMDNVVWNPACDPHIKAVYNAQCLQARHYNRTALLSEFGLMVPSSMPIFGIISRLSHEKGLDLLRRAIWPLLRQGAGLIVLGTGARSLERQFRRMACMWPGQVGLHLGFDEKLAHRILAGTDAVIIPSRMEPCGLVQMYAQRYGALPVVRRTGGLADSVCAETGFLFDRPESDDMQQALQSVMDMYACKDQWLYMQQAAMRKHYCWRQAADKYIAVYNTAMRRGA